MKKIHINAIRVIGIFGILTIMLVLLTVPGITSNRNSAFVVDGINEKDAVKIEGFNYENMFVDIDSVDVDKKLVDFLVENADANPDTFQTSVASDVVIEQNTDIASLQFELASIVQADVDFIESDQTQAQNFFDSNEIKGLVSEQFVLETSVQKFTGGNQIIPESNIFNVKSGSLVDAQGNFLDLGSLQIGFFGHVNYDSNLTYDVDVTFILDDKEIAKKKVSASGKTVDKKLRADINDVASGVKEKNFTFTFADEGKDWKNGETHVFKVIFSNVVAQVSDNNGNVKFFKWTGTYEPYRLSMTVDESKNTIFDSDLNKAISVFKSDGRLVLSVGADSSCLTNPVALTVAIFDKNGNKLGEGFSNQQKVTNWKNWNGDDRTTCSPIQIFTDSFAPRQSEFFISINIKSEYNSIDEKIVYISPKTQNNINISCTEGFKQHNSISAHTKRIAESKENEQIFYYSSTAPTQVLCSSNIGWQYP